MKVAVLLAYAVLTTKRVTCAAIKAPLDVISMDDVTNSDRRLLDFLNVYYHTPRPKRSHEDALHSIKASIGQGLKHKLGLLAKGSASASGHFSSGSSGGHSYHHDVHEAHDHKSFDFWSLKKAILNTLLQAVKAIKGGVIAVKGQLIKGSGYLISAKGKLISAKGEAITKLGKNIATKAVLSSPHGHSEDYTHGHYHHSSPEEYGSPSAPGPEYEVPEHHYHHHSPHHEDKPDVDHAGILILKKIPVHHEHHVHHDDHDHHEHHEHSEHLPLEHKIPDFKPIDHKGPGLGEIIGKFFSASTSLKPGVPAPFGDEHDHHHYHHDHDHEHQVYHDHDHEHQTHHHHDHESHIHHDHDHETHIHHDHEHDHGHHEHDHGHHHYSEHSSHEEYHGSPHPHSSHDDSHHEYSSQVAIKSNSKAPSVFEEAPDFLNLPEHTSESKAAPQTATPAPVFKPQAEPLKQLAAPLAYDEVRPLPTSFSNLGFDTASFLADSDKANLFGGTFSTKPIEAFPLSVSLPVVKPTSLASDVSSLQFGAFPNTGSVSNLKYLAPPSVGPQVFPQQSFLDNANPYPAYPPAIKQHALLDNAQSAFHKSALKRPTRSKNSPYRKRPSNPSSVARIRTNGPKRH